MSAVVRRAEPPVPRSVPRVGLALVQVQRSAAAAAGPSSHPLTRQIKRKEKKIACKHTFIPCFIAGNILLLTRAVLHRRSGSDMSYRGGNMVLQLPRVQS
jgi:hypothetical protein